MLAIAVSKTPNSKLGKQFLYAFWLGKQGELARSEWQMSLLRLSADGGVRCGDDRLILAERLLDSIQNARLVCIGQFPDNPPWGRSSAGRAHDWQS